MEHVIVSACLLGLRTRYDGRSKPNEALANIIRDKAVIPVCPEQMGGLPTPRPPAEITHGDGSDVLAGTARLINVEGDDVTAQYIHGSEQVAALAKRFAVKAAYLKSKSPACGVHRIKKGDEVIKGSGVCAALLALMGITLIEMD